MTATTARILSLATGLGGAVAISWVAQSIRIDAQQASALVGAAGCRITGRVTSGAQPIPGVSLVLRTGDLVRGATSTDLDGRYSIVVPPRWWTTNRPQPTTALRLAMAKTRR
jgi:hypothetical protein